MRGSSSVRSQMQVELGQRRLFQRGVTVDICESFSTDKARDLMGFSDEVSSSLVGAVSLASLKTFSSRTDRCQP